ncbi:MAG: hypothetical protein ABIJ50_11670 [Pseudomonadota bacterium]
MTARTTLIKCLILCLSLTLLTTHGTTAQAGMVSRVASKVATRKAAQRSAFQATEKRLVVNAERAAARQAGKKAESTALAEAKAKAQLAARQERNGQINMAERSRHTYAYDKLRDKSLPVKPLAQKKSVYRYHPSVAQARQEIRQGVPGGSHLTASSSRVGRPIGGATAQSRLGLAQQPAARTTVTLPAGIKVKQGKVLGGQAGYGEIVPVRRVKPKYVSDFRILSQ